MRVHTFRASISPEPTRKNFVVCFRVESVEEAVRELAALGIEATPIRLDDYTGEKLCFFFDPDGLPLELHE